uniref:RRM domain-containing protein n=1 Tax=Ditylenchus dipsaci TaxID=166011 RepID=A0A915DN62_9BILA
MVYRKEGKIVEIRNNDRLHRYRNFEVSPVRNSRKEYMPGRDRNRPRHSLKTSSRPIIKSPSSQKTSKYVNSSEPIQNSKEPLKNSSEPIQNSKEPFNNSKEPFNNSKEPLNNSKEPYRQVSEPRYNNSSRAMRKSFVEKVESSLSSAIHVGGLPLDVTHYELKKFFGERFGRIVNIRVGSTKNRTCFAIVEFSDVDHAQKAVKCLGGVRPRPKIRHHGLSIGMSNSSR